MAATLLAAPEPEEPEDPNPYGFPWTSYPDHHGTYDDRLRDDASRLIAAGLAAWVAP